jgi:hypothetical protein
MPGHYKYGKKGKKSTKKGKGRKKATRRKRM